MAVRCLGESRVLCAWSRWSHMGCEQDYLVVERSVPVTPHISLPRFSAAVHAGGRICASCTILHQRRSLSWNAALARTEKEVIVFATSGSNQSLEPTAGRRTVHI